MASKKKLRRKIRILKRRLRNYAEGVDFDDISITITPEGKSVIIRFAQPMIYCGASSPSGFNFDTFTFMTHDHPSLPYRNES